MSQEVHAVAEAAAEVAHATEATGGLGTLGINLKIFIAQLLNFSVVLLVLWKWAYKPIVNMLDARSEKIEKSLKDAEEVEKRVESLEEERKSVIAQAKAEANLILEKAREDADSRKTELLTKAKDEVSQVVRQGKGQLQAEKEQMLREVKKEIVELSVAAASKILAETVDEKKAQDLAGKVVEELS